MLNFWDWIKINVADAQGTAEYNREMRRGGRAAGIIHDQDGTNTSVDNNNANKSTNETASDEAKKSSRKKAEQARKAEAECPAEEPGAEKIKDDAKVGNNVEADNEAAMAAKIPHIADASPNVIDMSAFGVQIDMGKMCGETSNPVQVQLQPNNFQTAPNMNVSGLTPQQQWAMQQQAAAAQQQNAVVQNPQSPNQQNPYLAHINQVIGNGRHRVDQPKQPPKPERAKADEVDVNLPDIKMDVQALPVKKVPEVISTPIPQADPIEVDKTPIFDNSHMIAKYGYLNLGEIEKLAIECGAQVQFIERADSLINCIVYNGNLPAKDKGFAIDSGNIIDRRKKIFPGIFQFYEGCQAYPLFIPNGKDKENGKKSQNVLNVELLKGLFVGGNDYPNERNGLYRPEFRDLNKYVALITIPTKDISNNERKNIQNRLVELYNKEFFKKIYIPGSRFRVVSYDKKTGDFVISNEGVPANYGAPVIPVTPMSFTVEKNRVVRN